MSLATRCPVCQTVFRVVQDQLKVSEGWVRCGRCAKVFNAFEGLFDLQRRRSGCWRTWPHAIVNRSRLRPGTQPSTTTPRARYRNHRPRRPPARQWRARCRMCRCNAGPRQPHHRPRPFRRSGQSRAQPRRHRRSAQRSESRRHWCREPRANPLCPTRMTARRSRLRPSSRRRDSPRGQTSLVRQLRRPLRRRRRCRHHHQRHRHPSHRHPSHRQPRWHR